MQIMDAANTVWLKAGYASLNDQDMQNRRASLAIKACFQLRSRLHTTVWLPHQVEE